MANRCGRCWRVTVHQRVEDRRGGRRGGDGVAVFVQAARELEVLAEERLERGEAAHLVQHRALDRDQRAAQHVRAARTLGQRGQAVERVRRRREQRRRRAIAGGLLEHLHVRRARRAGARMDLEHADQRRQRALVEADVAVRHYDHRRIAVRRRGQQLRDLAVGTRLDRGLDQLHLDPRRTRRRLRDHALRDCPRRITSRRHQQEHLARAVIARGQR